MAGDEFDPVSQVAKALLRSDNLGQAVVTVEGNENGKITLRGTVETEQDLFAVEALAQKQKGVVEVVNRLRASRL